MTARFILIQGAPGVGKTTIARRLEQDTGIKLIAKDDIKEHLYNRLGLPSNKDESMLYGRVAIRSVYVAIDEFMKAGQRVIAEGAFLPEYALKDISSIVALSDVMQLYVHCDSKVRERRFSSRVTDGTRHPGHIDTEIDMATEWQRYGAIPDIETIMVNTTDFSELDYQAVLVKVQNYFKEGNYEATN